ncbi:hypothetical protein TrLO_g6940 [Triparma laevis f. longispina]|nr:hypothetical protein TrLO_g6940 [Triparma laevis f. longispina]
MAETPENQPAFDISMSASLPKALPGDWLFDRKESGQTVSFYQRQIKPGGQYLVPNRTMNKILLVPIGKSFSSEIGHMFIPLLTRLCSDFFTGFEVEAYPTPISLKGVTRRENEYENLQYKIDEIFTKINKETSRDHKIYARLGITLEDIYPDDNWNFVYGQARMIERCGVFSFCRHSPLFNTGAKSTSIPHPVSLSKFLRRCAKTMTHEITHMLGIRHCIYYQCLMNGNNGGGERAAKSSFLCPVCLRKVSQMLSLSQSAPVNLKQRYKNIKEGWESVLATFEGSGEKGIENDVRWLEMKIEFMESMEGGGTPVCVECNDVPKFIGSDSDDSGSEEESKSKEESKTDDGAVSVEVPLIRSSTELINLLSTISGHSTLSFSSVHPPPSDSLASSIITYALPVNPPTLNTCYIPSMKLGKPGHPNIPNFLFNHLKVDRSAHFDWWMFPTAHVGKSLFSAPSKNIFMVKSKEEFRNLMDTNVYLLKGEERIAELNYSTLVMACIGEVPNLNGVRNVKVQAWISNVAKLTKERDVIEDATGWGARLPRCRIEDWMMH